MKPATRRIVFVLAGFAVLICAALLAIPTMDGPGSTAIANETSAIQSIRAINLAEAQFQKTYPAQGYACSLTALGGDPHSAPPTPSNAQMLPQDLASGVHAGYSFKINNCLAHNVNGIQRITSYKIIAQPLSVGQSGERSFCSDESGEIRYDPNGGTNCTQVLR